VHAYARALQLTQRRARSREFRARFRPRFVDPAFEAVARELDASEAVAWEAYSQHRKAPRTRKAGREFADPDYDLSIDWLATRDAVAAAQRRPRDRGWRTQRAHVSRRAVEDAAARRHRRRVGAAQRRARRAPRSVAGHG